SWSDETRCPHTPTGRPWYSAVQSALFSLAPNVGSAFRLRYPAGRRTDTLSDGSCPAPAGPGFVSRLNACYQPKTFGCPDYSAVRPLPQERKRVAPAFKRSAELSSRVALSGSARRDNRHPRRTIKS